MQNCPQQRKGFTEPEAIDVPRVLDTAVPSASTGMTHIPTETAARQKCLVF